MAKHYDKQFKLDAIRYYHDHRELGLQGCASNLGISYQTLSRWQKELRDTGDIESRVSVSGMLKILGVSRSGYRAWLKHVPSNAEKRRESVKAKIKDIYDKSKQNYGAPKITQVLRKTGETISERTVGQYMKQMGIKAQWVKPWTITTRDSDFSSKLQNILDEQFNPERPNAVWCSDITYIWTIDVFVYLTSIMDLYSRKIIAWTLSNTLEVSCVIETINKAKAKRKIEEPLIMHSDRGVQYVSKEYKRVTANMQCSYSKKAYPWDNACIESFHSLIKREWQVKMGKTSF